MAIVPVDVFPEAVAGRGLSRTNAVLSLPFDCPSSSDVIVLGRSLEGSGAAAWSGEGPSIPYYEVYPSRLRVPKVQAVSVSAKLTRREAELLDRLTREYGFISKSEAIRSAVRLYLNLFELRSKDRLRMLQLINELIAPSVKTSSDLVEEGHREEDEI